ncbi:murein transglycosylase A [Pontivivens insulae]|uniref:peptidoglycan lytic exotransglycosylase n=1 Tax=Pontivivens insulae TaxID=1639689 RepID=A0A2R8A7T0_9RHOB|nr:murein transglycosylase A [Pontivivens insulae]RED18327.1 membrane-bound lytic murein transglycosylase A [Pontivivens insulae]SPF28225.1 Membrane-bound lytic murein transglycosylase A [Pontivivens insulae]
MRTIRAIFCGAALLFATAASSQMMTPMSFEDLDGWADDDHAAAMVVFRRTCAQSATGDLVPDAIWQGLCRAAEFVPDARAFFETAFQPVMITDGNDPLFTGYYEPELQASRSHTDTFRYPLYRRPPEVAGTSAPWLSRAEIEAGALRGRGLELAWLADPVDAFFLHVQGSGRLRLTDGSVMRVGFGGRNNHTYRSVGRHMAETGLLPAHQVSAGAIRNWVRENGDAGRRVLNHNPSYIFFVEVEGLRPEDGPIGAMSAPVTAMRSVAVDRSFTPLGLPVWVETTTTDGPFARLMIAQDVGAAINGAQRADIFFGSGAEAYRQAAVQRYGGRLITFFPRSLLGE